MLKDKHCMYMVQFFFNRLCDLLSAESNIIIFILNYIILYFYDDKNTINKFPCLILSTFLFYSVYEKIIAY